jgi:glycogen phosphorylase
MPRKKVQPSAFGDDEQHEKDTVSRENRTGTRAAKIAGSFRNHMTHSVGRPLELSNLVDKHHAAALTVRDRLMDQWLKTIATYRQGDVRVLAYLSAEYLLGPHLQNDLLNLDLAQSAEQVTRPSATHLCPPIIPASQQQNLHSGPPRHPDLRAVGTLA